MWTNPNDANSVPADNDTDGTCDLMDTDDDNDGWSDSDEDDCGNLQIQFRPDDTDSMEHDPLDTDDDGDGWNDIDEVNCGLTQPIPIPHQLILTVTELAITWMMMTMGMVG